MAARRSLVPAGGEKVAGDSRPDEGIRDGGRGVMSLAGPMRDEAPGDALYAARLQASMLLAQRGLPDDLADALLRGFVVEVERWKKRHPAHAFLAPRPRSLFCRKYQRVLDALAGEP